MISISLKRPVTITMIVAFLIFFGAVSYSRLGRDLLPNISYPSLTVKTDYEGASPQEVEEFITKKLESSLSTVKGKRDITSISREGVSLITISFQWGEDMQLAVLNVREKLDQTRFRSDFPQDAERPNILRWDPSSKPIVGLAISSDTPILDLKEGVREIIKPRLEQLEGVAFAQITGDIERVIDIEVDRKKLMLFNISLDDIKDAIDRSNQNLPGGTIKKGRYRYSLRTMGEFASVEEINRVVVTRKGGTDIIVSDVAEVRDTIKDRESMATVNGTEAIGLLIYKEAGANTIEATRLIKQFINDLGRTNNDFTMTLAFEEAKFIEQALNNVWLSLVFGGFFAFFVLVLFLGDLKSPIYIFLSIPIAIISTIMLMFFSGVSLNLMSLGGLALGVGMLVDNSIVVLENIYRHREAGLKPMEAAWRGAREVAAPVAASTLTTIAVFFPIVYLKGVAGALFGEQALTVTYSMISSLLVSLTVLPLLSVVGTILHGRDSFPAKLPSMPRIEAKEHPRGFWFWSWWEFLIAALAILFVAAYFKLEWKDGAKIVLGLLLLPLAFFVLKWVLTFLLSWLFQILALIIMIFKNGVMWLLNHLVLPVFNFCFKGFEHVYHTTLIYSLERKMFTLGLSLALLVLISMAGMNLKRELMPKSATGQFSIDAKLPPGTALEVTAATVTGIENLLTQDPHVDVVFAQIGASEANVAQLLRDSGTNTAQISVKLKPNHITLDEVYRLSGLVREYAKEVPGLAVSFKESESSFEDLLEGEGGSGLVVQIEGELFESLFNANDQVVEALKDIPEIQDLKTSLVRNYPQVQVGMKRDVIERYGFTLSEVGNYLSGGMRGALATQYKEFDRNIEVRVRFSEQDREQFERVLETTLMAPGGTAVPLHALLDVKVVRTAKEIRRVNQKRVALVTANLGSRKISEVVPKVEDALAGVPFAPGIITSITGEEKGIQSSFEQLGFAFLLSCILVYMIMAGQFESLRFPFVVIFTLPMGLIGTVIMLYTFGQSINIMSLIGLIVLSGIVVNDAIVKVDFINQARHEGKSVREAIIAASRVRLRPILMTTATTVLGLVPMGFGLVPLIAQLPGVNHLLVWADEAMISRGYFSPMDLFSGQGAEIQTPLALVVIGGLTLATMMTLIVIPVLYEVFAGKDLQASNPEEAPVQTPTSAQFSTGDPA